MFLSVHNDMEENVCLIFIAIFIYCFSSGCLLMDAADSELCSGIIGGRGYFGLVLTVLTFRIFIYAHGQAIGWFFHGSV